MNIRMVYTVVLLVTVMVAGPLVRAEKPVSPGKSGNPRAAAEQGAGQQAYFTEDRIARIQRYYITHGGAGGCPPGLAKKNNGCLPPGQAKQWRRGETLPPGIVYSDLPGDLMVVLGGVPAGRKVVRVDEDLLLISIATGLVLEALEL